jgi:hypothetical protein
MILKELFAYSSLAKKADVDDFEAVGSLKIQHRIHYLFGVHTIQDSYSGSHSYQNWPGGFPSLAHEKGDYSLSNYTSATSATRRYLQALSGACCDGKSRILPRLATVCL